jgi:hypothetical protein
MNFDDYEVKIQYPERPRKPVMGDRSVQGVRAYADALEKWEHDMVSHRIKLSVFRDEQVKLDERFKQDVLRENGLVGHPKAEKVFALAWEEGRSSGYSEVADRVERLAELVKD